VTYSSKEPCPEGCGRMKEKKSKTCRPCSGLKHRGELHYNYNGGRAQCATHGYITLSGKHDHPNANHKGEIREHVYVMSNYLGRALREDEIVHHKNGNRADNRLDNLELCSDKRQPPGQRISDLVAWARDVISLYGDEFPVK
jgi:hypothetical protein